MKPLVLLDLANFAIPNAVGSPDELNTLLEGIHSWYNRVSSQNCIDIVVDDFAIDTLTAANCFPATHNVASLLEMFGLEHVFSPRDINKTILKILSRSLALSDATGVRVIECDVDCSPLDVVGSVSCELLDSTKRSVCTLALLANEMPGVDDILFFVPGFPYEGEELQCSAHITSHKIGCETLSQKDNLEANVRTARIPEGVLTSLTPASVWRFAENGS